MLETSRARGPRPDGSACISCGARGGVFVCEKVDPSSQRIVLQRCHDCGLVYQRGWTDLFDVESYDYYAPRIDWPAEAIYKPVNTHRVKLLLDELGDEVTGRTLLDVGCGSGHIVHVGATRGWTAEGIDLSKSAIALARRFGSNCHELDFFDASLDARRFDVVVMSEFIEHVPDPGRFLQRAAELLTPNGILYLTTPNFDSISRRYLGADGWSAIHEQHLSYFTPRTFAQLVAARSGLRIEWMETRNISPEAIAQARAFVARSLRRKGARATTTAPSGAPWIDAPQLRSRIEKSPFLRAAKTATNRLLDAAGVGDALVAVLRLARAS